METVNKHMGKMYGQLLMLNKATSEMITQLCIHKADPIGISNQNHEEHVVTWEMLMAK